MIARYCLTAMLLAGCAVSLFGQAPASTPAPGIAPGERIRVTFVGSTPPTQTAYGPIEAPPTTEKGTVGSVRADTIEFRPDGASDPLRVTDIPVAHIQHLDVSGGMHRHTLAGLAWGGVSGVVVGAVFGASSYHQCQSQAFCVNISSQAGYIASGALVLGLIGGAVGSIVGTLIKTEKWTRVPGYPVAKLTVVPLQHGAVGYGLALRF